MLAQLFNLWSSHHGGYELSTRKLIETSPAVLVNMLVRAAPNPAPDKRHVPSPQHIGRWLRTHIDVPVSAWCLKRRKVHNLSFWHLAPADQASYEEDDRLVPTAEQMRTAATLQHAVNEAQDRVQYAQGGGLDGLKHAQDLLARRKKVAQEYFDSIGIPRR